MTVRALAGILVLNLSFLGVGASLLWCLGSLETWGGAVRLAGVAQLAGAAALAAALTLALVAGAPVNGWVVVLAVVVLAVAALSAGVLRGIPAPRRTGTWRLPRLTILGGLLVAALAVQLEALFRSARLQPLDDWDTWWVWTLKAKALYAFGDLGGAPFLPAGPGGAYPPGLPLLQAASFHAMGSADVVTMHLLHWSLAVGFAAAVVGLLAPRVRLEVVLPFLLLLFVTPSVLDRIVDGKADLPLAYLTATGALLLLLWLLDRQPWQLATGTLLLTGAMLTKREGLLLAACVFLAALVASVREPRRSWPQLLGAGALALALSLPWRLWFRAEGLPSDAPATGYFGFLDHLDRVWPSFRLVVHTLFDYDLWTVLPPLAVASVAAAFLARAWRIAVFATAFASSAVLASTWVIASNPEYEITQDFGLNPVVRLVGDTVVVLAALAPLALYGAWTRRGALTASLRQARAAWAIAAIGALVYPASMLAGTSALRLPGGPPEFPSASDCVEPVAAGRPARVVLAYVETYADARAIQRRARPVARETRVDQDGCGRLRVFVGVSSEEAGRELAAAARALDLDASVEGDPDEPDAS